MPPSALRRGLSRLTYANVMATIAVALALGAGSYAIGAVPDRKGRIPACYQSSGKHKGTLRVLTSGIRCRTGERKLTWNQAGPAGSAGPAGAAGKPGAPGAAGATEAFNQGLSPGGPGLSLAVGSYDVQANVHVTNDGLTQDVTCTLAIGAASSPGPSPSPGVGRDIATVTVPAGAKAVIPLHQIHQLTAPGPANVECTGPAFWNGTIVAVKVGLVHEI